MSQNHHFTEISYSLSLRGQDPLQYRSFNKQAAISEGGQASEMPNNHSDFVGIDVKQVPKPAAVLDVAKIRKHCSLMLDVVKSLGIGFRAHVKTHKVSKALQTMSSKVMLKVNLSRQGKSQSFNLVTQLKRRNWSYRQLQRLTIYYHCWRRIGAVDARSTSSTVFPSLHLNFPGLRRSR